MALDSALLKTEMETKVREKNPELVALLDDPTTPASLDWLLESISEAVVDHFKNNAEVKVVVIGLDSGSSLPADILTALATRGDGSPPFAPPDAGLQQDSTLVDTTPGATSAVLSVPGLIE